MSISNQGREELTWWIDSIETASNSINRGEVDITLTSDASKQGRGAATGDSSTGGLWTAEEAKEQFNFLEMLAVLFAYRADPEAFAINAFHMSWQPYLFYAFPPFSLITRVLQKIQEEKATGLVLVLKSPTQPWWPKLMQMLIQLPVQLPKNNDTLFLPSNPQELHPLHKKLCLILCHLSGDTSMAKAFRQQLPPSWNNPGGQAQESYLTSKMAMLILQFKGH